MKEFKTCQECGMEFRSIGSFGTQKKLLIVTVRQGKGHLSCRQAKLKKWWRKQQTKLFMIKIIVRMCYKNSEAKLSACNWLKVPRIMS